MIKATFIYTFLVINWQEKMSVPIYIMFLCYIRYTYNQQELGKLRYEPCFQIEFEGNKQRFL